MHQINYSVFTWAMSRWKTQTRTPRLSAATSRLLRSPISDRRCRLPLNLNAMQAGRLQPLACRRRRRRLGDSACAGLLVCGCSGSRQRRNDVFTSRRLPVCDSAIRVGSGGWRPGTWAPWWKWISGTWHVGNRATGGLAGHLGLRGGKLD